MPTSPFYNQPLVLNQTVQDFLQGIRQGGPFQPPRPQQGPPPTPDYTNLYNPTWEQNNPWAQQAQSTLQQISSSPQGNYYPTNGPAPYTNLYDPYWANQQEGQIPLETREQEIARKAAAQQQAGTPVVVPGTADANNYVTEAFREIGLTPDGKYRIYQNQVTGQAMYMPNQQGGGTGQGNASLTNQAGSQYQGADIFTSNAWTGVKPPQQGAGGTQTTNQTPMPTDVKGYAGSPWYVPGLYNQTPPPGGWGGGGAKNPGAGPGGGGGYGKPRNDFQNNMDLARSFLDPKFGPGFTDRFPQTHGGLDPISFYSKAFTEVPQDVIDRAYTFGKDVNQAVSEWRLNASLTAAAKEADFLPDAIKEWQKVHGGTDIPQEQWEQWWKQSQGPGPFFGFGAGVNPWSVY